MGMLERHGVTICAVHGGFVIEWNEVYLVEKPQKMEYEQPQMNMGKGEGADKPLKGKSMPDAYEEHRLAVREKISDVAILLTEILSRKMKTLDTLQPMFTEKPE